MAGYITSWPKEQIRKLIREKDNGPIQVIFGSVHTRMPSIKSVKAGDVIYPVTIEEGTLCVMARLPVEKTEPAYEYLIRKLRLSAPMALPLRQGQFNPPFLMPSFVELDSLTRVPKKDWADLQILNNGKTLDRNELIRIRGML